MEVSAKENLDKKIEEIIEVLLKNIITKFQN